MSKFGWDYPPGCNGPPDDDTACEVCGHEAGDCQCPACPKCGTAGDPECYRVHGLSQWLQEVVEQRQALLDAARGLLAVATIDYRNADEIAARDAVVLAVADAERLRPE